MMNELQTGMAIAFDFDGVIHKYSEGWKDGSIYDGYNDEVIELMHILQSMDIPVFILSTRDPHQIKEWWDKHLSHKIPTKLINDDTQFYNDTRYVGITRIKLPAQLYIDNRAYRYTGQTATDFLYEFTV